MKEQALQQLRDLHLPSAIGAWPLAIGWYFVIGIAALAIISFSIWFYRHLKAQRPRKQALKKLSEIEQEYQQQQNPNHAAYEISVLLKRFAYTTHKRDKVASLHGKDWLAFIGNPSWGKSLQQLNYQKSSDTDLQSLFPQIKKWLKKWPTKKGAKHV